VENKTESGNAVRQLQMRMAKASKEDIEKCIQFFNVIEEFMEMGNILRKKPEMLALMILKRIEDEQ